MYYEYWGLKKPPFDNVPDPTMYVDCHSSVENAVAETLFAIEEGNECVAVIVGDVGSGKTLSLRLILDALQPDRYRIAFITNPAVTFGQLVREIIGQATGTTCEIKRKVDLLERFNRLLFETIDEGKKILIFVDEANAIPPAELEGLRLLTNMQDDAANLFTVVLAGQMEFAKRLEHPRRANLFQRIGTYCRIDRMGSVDMLRSYVENRIRLAGGKRMIFDREAVEALWENSEHGVPRLVNKICKLCMKAGETNGFPIIGAEVVRQVGERFQKQTGPRKSTSTVRRRTARAAAVARPEPVAAKPASSGAESDVSWETEIESARITIDIPLEVLEEARSSTREDRMKLAGALAAETLQKNSHLTLPALKDPVTVWNDIRNSILDALEKQQKANTKWQRRNRSHAVST
jgi:type II secretory pathway predicted ATPase ExeA